VRTNQTVRAVAFDRDGNLVLIKRTRSGRQTYWVAPGGGVESEDNDLESALRRELFEELHAEVEIGAEVLVFRSGDMVTHIFLVRISRMSPDLRTGPEFADISRGMYEVECIEPFSGNLRSLNILPDEVRAFVAEHVAGPA
jgi:8-oxo-dGTP pyrophosphatase MutT (NUDIX family)